MQQLRALGWLGLGLLAACGTAGTLAGEGRFSPETRWGAPAYILEPFAYFPIEHGRVAWMPLGDRVLAPRAEGDPGVVVVPTRLRKFVALDGRDGRLRWELPTLGANVARPVALPGTEDLIVASLDGTVSRVTRRLGRVVWTSERAGHGVAADPVVVGAGDGARVLVTSLGNRLVALSAGTGELLWMAERDHDAPMTVAGHGGALALGDRVIAGFSDGRVGAWALEDGASLWTADLSQGGGDFSDVDASPVAVEGPGGERLVVLSVHRRGLVALTADGGDVAWQVRGEAFLAPVHEGGLLVASQASGVVWGVEAATGRVRWRTALGTGEAGEVTLTPTRVLAPSGKDLAVLDRVSGRITARWGDGRGLSARPWYANGSLYLLGHSGMVWALDAP